MKELARFSVTLPNELFDEINKRVKNVEYPSRSEFIRDLVREKIIADKWKDDSQSDAIAVLSIVYSHHQNNLVSQMLELEHHADVKIACSTHIHIDKENCLEMISLQGSGKNIEKFSQKIGSLKGVKFSNLARIGITKA